MRRSPVLRAGIVAFLAVAPLLVSSMTALAADSSIGETFTANVSCAGGYTLLQTASVTPSFSVPSKGVITSIRMTGGSADTVRQFKLARPAGSAYTVVDNGALLIPANQSASALHLRIPTQAGDVLGEYVPSGTTACTKSTGNSGDVVTIYPGNIDTGQIATGGTAVAQSRISIAATVEPDVDGDDYGDTTQDACPVEAISQGKCALDGIRGIARVGKKLAAPVVPTTPVGTIKKFRWYRLTKVMNHGSARSVYRLIAGANSAKYKLRVKDKGKKVLARITLTAPGGMPTTLTTRPRRVH